MFLNADFQVNIVDELKEVVEGFALHDNNKSVVVKFPPDVYNITLSNNSRKM